MTRFRAILQRIWKNSSIRTKLNFVIMLSSTLTLILIITGLGLYQFSTFRGRMVNDLSAIADLVATNSTAALSFDNQKDAREILGTLAFHPEVLSAVLYGKDGSWFATYDRTVDGKIPIEYRYSIPQKITGKNVGWSFSLDRLTMVRPVILNNSEIGFLLVQASLDGMYGQMRSYVGITLGVLLVALVLSFVFGNILQRRISQPVLALADLARGISQKNDYSMRAPKDSTDEIGTLVAAFNEMLSQIEERRQMIDRAQNVLIGEIAERKKAQIELSITNERLDLAQTVGHIGAFEWDVVHRTIAWTGEFLAVSGIREDCVPGYTREEWESIIHPTDREWVGQSVARAIDENTDLDLEFRILLHTNNGEKTHRWIAFRARMFREEPSTEANIGGGKLQERRMIGVISDITERKRVEQGIRALNEELERKVKERTQQLLLSNKELEAFSYSVSHDLRAPLRAISGYAGMLQQGAGERLDSEQNRYLDTIRKSVIQMGVLVDGLLDYSRLGRKNLVNDTINISDLFRTIVDEAVASTDTQGRHFEISIAPDLPSCSGDPTLIRQVIVNLVSNAVKFSGKRKPSKIEIGLAARANGNSFVTYYIRDNGAGFNMEYSDKLFGVFQRLHHADEFDGTGVGLAFSKRIIERHGGKIWAEAREDEGATFFFTLPASLT